MTQFTVTTNDVFYIGYKLKEKDPTTGSITFYTLDTASSIVFRMRLYGATANAIEAQMETVDASTGYCRALVTIPVAGDYYSEIEVYETTGPITWKGSIYHVESELG